MALSNGLSRVSEGLTQDLRMCAFVCCHYPLQALQAVGSDHSSTMSMQLNCDVVGLTGGRRRICTATVLTAMRRWGGRKKRRKVRLECAIRVGSSLLLCSLVDGLQEMWCWWCMCGAIVLFRGTRSCICPGRTSPRSDG